MPGMQTVHTINEMFDCLGGTVAVSKIIGCTQPAASNYRKRDDLPPTTFRQLAAELIERDLRAPLTLWRSIPSDAIELAARIA